VLVAGGTNNGVALTSAELYNRTTGTWASTGSMHVARTLAHAVLLSNGAVLVMGGCVNDCLSTTTNSAELYNPTAKTWTLGTKMTTARSDYASIMLGTGKVLFIGGENINGVSIKNAELYDPTTGKFTATGNMMATRVEHTAVLLANGKVLVSGGNNQTINGATPLASAELYNPATGTWTATGSLSHACAGHTSTVLHSGHVLNTGGSDAVNELDSAELYTP
jgi:N-acetylneuraminic acid mutarotase